MQGEIKVLVVDDSSAYRNIIKKVVPSVAGLTVVSSAMNAVHALQRLDEFHPDLVLLDVNLPGSYVSVLHGEIRSHASRPMVLLMSSENFRNSTTILEEIQKGAIGFLGKPEGSDFAANSANLKDQLKALAPKIFSQNKNRLWGSNEAQPSKEAVRPKLAPAQKPVAQFDRLKEFHLKSSTVFSLIVVGVSTGGPAALDELFRKLPAVLPAPMIIVQHMPEAFTAKLAESLNRLVKQDVEETRSGMVVKPNTIYVAKGGEHLYLEKDKQTYTLRNDFAPPVQSCRPSVDVFFESVAQAMSVENVLSIILTGMGQDGCNGVAALKTKNCYSIAQSEESCVVYGMPRAIIEANLADKILNIEEIANFLHRSR